MQQVTEGGDGQCVKRKEKKEGESQSQYCVQEFVRVVTATRMWLSWGGGGVGTTEEKEQHGEMLEIQ